MKNTILFIVAVVIAGGSGFVLQKNINQQPNQMQSRGDAAIGQQRPEFAAPDLDDEMRNIKEWDGKIILLNFWATWCPPCLTEIPEFIELQHDYGDQGVQFIGLAIDDEEAVREYVKEVGMNYPSLVVEADGIGLAKRYGNDIGALPYTVIINRNGEISGTITGELNKIHAKELLKKHGIQL